MTDTRKRVDVTRSGFEKLVKEHLMKEKVEFEYEPYRIPYYLHREYIPDFVIYSEEGKKDPLRNIHIEVKGFFKPLDRQKMVSLKECNPTLDIRLWFQRDNYLTKAKKMKYSDWAIKNGFIYHVGEELPLEWIRKK